MKETIIAFIGGFATFFTPCVLPLIPTYIIYLTGMSMGDIVAGKKLLALKHSVFFVLGFSTVFIILGLTVTAISGVFFANKEVIEKFGGAILVLLGFFIVLGYKPKFLMKDTRYSIASKPVGYLGSFLVGAAFSGGWSPCMGPALVMIFSLTVAQDTLLKGLWLLLLFSAGLAVPFILAGLFIEHFTRFLAKFKKQMRRIEMIFGVFLALIGALMLLNKI